MPDRDDRPPYEPPPLPPVDAAELERRAAELAAPAPPSAADLAAVLAALDLTTLEATDTPERVRALCARAVEPVPGRPDAPAVAAVCVFPSLVSVARAALAGSPVRVASVAGGFPSGQTFLAVKLEEVRRAVGEGADEIDLPLSRAAFLAGEHARAFDELAAVREAAGPARLKVILETGELGGPDAVRGAARLALDAGADFVKTSTGKIAAGATPADVLLLLDAVRDLERENGRRAGVKASGGIRRTGDALRYLALARAVLGEGGAGPERFRLGVSSLLDDLVRAWG